MIRVAICDDNEREAKRISDFMKQYFIQANIMFEYHIFFSSKNLLYEVEDSIPYDLFLLDIEMPEMNGMELTARIKSFLPNAIVILITTHEKYVYDAFKVQPYRFVPKNRIEEMLAEALKDAVNCVEQQEGEYFVVTNQKGVEKILQKNITHIWHSGKYSYIEKQDGGNAKIRATLKDVYKELNQNMFKWIDRGTICNFEQIMKIVGNDVVLKNGDKLDISGDRIVEVKNMLREYWIEREGM